MINKELGENALPHGFTAIPFFTFGVPTLEDDIGYDACPLFVEDLNKNIDELRSTREYEEKL